MGQWLRHFSRRWSSENRRVLQDEEIRQGVKVYSEWPTFPQLYANSELVGGCDIIEELASTGELKQSIADELKNLKA